MPTLNAVTETAPGSETEPPSWGEQTVRWIVPALHATMGNWTYYVAVVQLAEIARRVQFAHVLHGADRNLNELIQRELEDRSEGISEYLIRQKKERFFNSLVIGLYEGNPDWYYASLRTHERLDIDSVPEYGREALGLLVFDGTERLFALDGQHRVAGIKQAVKSHPSIGNDFITVLFVPHENSKAGLERTRRLFTTLNRYAKPVAKARLIALDEDDAVAIVTRRLIASVPLFLNRTSTKQPKSIPRSDKTSVTTIGALYDAMNVYLRFDRNIGQSDWSTYKKTRPSDEEIDIMVSRAKRLWARLARSIDAFHEIVNGSLDTPGKLRRAEDGGQIWARPIGTMLLIDVIVALRRQGVSEPSAVRKLGELPTSLNASPWLGVLWDPVTRRMLTQAENRKVATGLALYMTGGDIASMKYTPVKLEKEWSALVGRVRKLTSL